MASQLRSASQKLAEAVMIDRNTIAANFGRCLVLIGVSLTTCVVQANDDLPRPLTTKQPFFSIPFFLNPNVPYPGEVVLHVSGDQGKKWTLYQKRRPDQGRFDFQAGADGEYWFVVRTSRDAVPAAGATKPEKIVIVDRQVPELKLDVSRNELGQVRVHWTARDPRLDPNSFSLEYKTSSDENWLPVTVDVPEQSSEARDLLEGQVTWTLRQPEGPAEVRAQVADQAGNRQEWLGPVVSSPDEPTSAPSASVVGSQPEPAPGLGNTPQLPQRSPDWLPHEPAPASSAADLRWKSSMPAASSPPAPTFTPVAASPQAATAPPASTEPSPPNSPDTFASAEYATRAQREIRWTKATRIELDYDVADAGDGGLGRVELWMTTDEGFTWNAHGVDEDLTSPFQVDLPQDGLFGFKLLIHDKQGRSAPAPTAGDEADLWVGLDRSPPQVRILDAKGTTSGETSSVQVTWSATDSNLGRSPIRILYGPSPEGPWAPLIGDLPNQGHYEGPTDNRLPARTFLKIEVRDEAGNLAETQTTEPIGQTGRPRGIIRGFKPLSFLPRSLWK